MAHHIVLRPSQDWNFSTLNSFSRLVYRWKNSTEKFQARWNLFYRKIKIRNFTEIERLSWLLDTKIIFIDRSVYSNRRIVRGGKIRFWIDHGLSWPFSLVQLLISAQRWSAGVTCGSGVSDGGVRAICYKPTGYKHCLARGLNVAVYFIFSFPDIINVGIIYREFELVRTVCICFDFISLISFRQTIWCSRSWKTYIFAESMTINYVE